MFGLQGGQCRCDVLDVFGLQDSQFLRIVRLQLLNHSGVLFQNGCPLFFTFLLVSSKHGFQISEACLRAGQLLLGSSQFPLQPQNLALQPSHVLLPERAVGHVLIFFLCTLGLHSLETLQQLCYLLLTVVQ